jgi:hypothetical protein
MIASAPTRMQRLDLSIIYRTLARIDANVNETRPIPPFQAVVPDLFGKGGIGIISF